MSWDGTDRRKGNKMDTHSYQPQTPFEGYVKATLDNIKERFDNLPCPESFKRLGKCETDIANMKGMATIIGIVAGGIAGFITKYIFGK